MDNPGEIMRLCRLCLVKDQVNIPIFDEQGDIRQIFLKISSCLPVKVSREDPLPKSICDGCSNKLDLLYEFRNTSANAEKTLLSWVGQADAKDVDETVTAAAHQVAKPSETQVKQEEVEESNPAPVQDIESMDAQESATFDESSAKDEEEEEPPPPKRARRTAAVKAQINIAPDSDDEDDDDDDLDGAEPMTKIEDESEESDDDKDPSYQDVPGTSADDQPGPSGVGKDGVEAPKLEGDGSADYVSSPIIKEEGGFPCYRCGHHFEAHEEWVEHLCNCILPTVKTEATHFFEEILKCPDGHSTFAARNCSNILTYQSEHDNFFCTECSVTLTEMESLREHIIKNHPRFSHCDVCDKQLFSNVNIHTQAQNELISEKECKSPLVDKKKLSCKKCGIIWRSSYAYIRHVCRVNEKNDHSSKELAPKISFSAQTCKDHLAPSKCDMKVDSMNFPSGNSVDNQLFECDIGSKKVRYCALRKRHDSVHSDDRPFLCDICGLGFKYQLSYNRHMELHVDNNPIMR